MDSAADKMTRVLISIVDTLEPYVLRNSLFKKAIIWAVDSFFDIKVPLDLKGILLNNVLEIGFDGTPRFENG